MRLPLCLLTLAGLGLATSCLNISPPATAIASQPPGARVLLDGLDTGWVTPCQIALDTDEVHALTIALDGYATRTLELVPAQRVSIVDWHQGVNGVRSTIRFPILLPPEELLFPIRYARALTPGRVFVRLRPEGAP